MSEIQTGYEDQWWFPVRIDAAYFARLRKDYPDKTDWSDEELREHFDGEDEKYSFTWDHLGDAKEEFEELADAFFKLHADHLAAIKEAREAGIREALNCLRDPYEGASMITLEEMSNADGVNDCRRAIRALLSGGE